jgi:ribosomal protein S18 acetylase RimI-like enzyme
LQIAAEAVTDDRFHADPRFPAEQAGKLKAAWLANDFAGRADCLLVAESEGRLAGYIACLLHQRAAVIDLVAVAPAAQGRGVGASLVEAAIAHYTGRAGHLAAGTQAHNRAAVRLYGKLGFREAQRATTLHRWWDAG